MWGAPRVSTCSATSTSSSCTWPPHGGARRRRCWPRAPRSGSAGARVPRARRRCACGRRSSGPRRSARSGSRAAAAAGRCCRRRARPRPGDWRSPRCSSTAATPAAPEGSSTSFMRSAANTSACAIDSSLTHDHLVDQRSTCANVRSPGSSPRCRRRSSTSRPSVTGFPASRDSGTRPRRGPGRRRCALTGAGLHGRRDPGDQPAAADRHDDRADLVRICSTISHPIVPWPAMTCGWSNGCTNTAPVLSRMFDRRLERLAEVLPDEMNLGSVALGGLDLGERRRLRHEDGRGDLGERRGESDALSVVAGRGRHDSGARARPGRAG